MKRTIILLSHYTTPVTGAHIRFERLAMGLIKDGGAVFWLSPMRSGVSLPHNAKFLVTPDVTGRRFASVWMALGVIFNIFSLFQLRKSRPLVVTFGETNLIPGFIATLFVGGYLSVGIRSNVKKCHSVNNLAVGKAGGGMYEGLMSLGFAVWGFIYRRAAQVIVQTPQAKLSAVENFNISPDRIEVLGNDIPVGRAAGCSAALAGPLPVRAIFVGNDSHIKGFDVLISALSSVDAGSLSIRDVTIVGMSEGAFRIADQAVTKRGMRLSWLKPTVDVLSIMAESDLLIVPSRVDEFPNVVLEAFALGLPVIGSNVDGIAHMIGDSRCLFEPGCPQDLLRVLAWVCTTDGYSHAIRILEKRARTFRFDWEASYISLLFDAKLSRPSKIRN